jgi:hypothetical protein
MNRDQVRGWEELIVTALETAFRQRRASELFSDDLPSPDDRTLHLMAKAAVTVLEATEGRGR